MNGHRIIVIAPHLLRVGLFCARIHKEVYLGGFRQYKEDGVTKETYGVTVSKNVMSYAGVGMAADYVNNTVQIGPKDDNNNKGDGGGGGFTGSWMFP